jgi:hypothetical protein
MKAGKHAVQNLTWPKVTLSFTYVRIALILILLALAIPAFARIRVEMSDVAGFSFGDSCDKLSTLERDQLFSLLFWKPVSKLEKFCVVPENYSCGDYSGLFEELAYLTAADDDSGMCRLEPIRRQSDMIDMLRYWDQVEK